MDHADGHPSSTRKPISFSRAHETSTERSERTRADSPHGVKRRNRQEPIHVVNRKTDSVRGLFVSEIREKKNSPPPDMLHS